MTKKEEDHADTLSKLEQERKQREEEFADQKAQLDQKISDLNNEINELKQ